MLNHQQKQQGISMALLALTVLLWRVCRAMECNPNDSTKQIDPTNSNAYLVCNLNGHFDKMMCGIGQNFNQSTLQCDSSFESSDDFDVFLMPQFQAPDDLCGHGTAMTHLSAPVTCNPSISSCPDGFVCTIYARTGDAYCCQNADDESSIDSELLCTGKKVTYFEVSTGKPQSCAITSPDASCPSGFQCELVSTGDGTTVSRCCGKDFGCPYNSAGLLNTNTNSYVPCSTNSRTGSTCPSGYKCLWSTIFETKICCSDHRDSAKPICPVGKPLDGEVPDCGSDANDCPTGYSCASSNGHHHCCPSHDRVCTLARDFGRCPDQRPTVTRFYFDGATGMCRSFKYAGCSGNQNNFATIEQCQGFCLAQQCKHGIAYRMDGLNAACSPSASNACPSQFTCERPLFGPVPVCCPTPALVCNEHLSFGTQCFGKSLKLVRYFYNRTSEQCEAFEYHGCSGNHNNFHSKQRCDEFCRFNPETICDGSAPLLDPNDELQKCSSSSPCPSGYQCTGNGFCCVTADLACSAPMSSGHRCSRWEQRTAWYYNPITKKCSQFIHLGCGGSANHFISQQACVSRCSASRNHGECPLEMKPALDEHQTSPLTCELNVVGRCPESSSCVRSTTNQAICCFANAKCPNQRVPYTIPGSDSIVSCQPNSNDCPPQTECVQSTVAGFYMCCSVSRSTTQMIGAANPSIGCPNNAVTNGQHCTINKRNACSNGFICLNNGDSSDGICCMLSPSCQRGTTLFVTNKQARICGPGLDLCPKDSACLVSTVDQVNVCCRFASTPTGSVVATTKYYQQTASSTRTFCDSGHSPFYEPGSRSPKHCLTSRRGQCPVNFECQAAKTDGLFYCCPVSPAECYDGRTAYRQPGSSQPYTCNFNSCPPGYSCDRSRDGQAHYCCMDDASRAKCPAGSIPYAYGSRSLACPAGSNLCPNGFSCTRSTVYSVHLCCSTSFSPVPTCRNGIAYINPVSSGPQYCTPVLHDCPPGYSCQPSSSPTNSLCCTSGQLNSRYAGYCPYGQIPYIRHANDEPETCHMSLRPCPISAQFTCIYSTEKMNSFCCAPIDTAAIGAQMTSAPNRVQQQPSSNYFRMPIVEEVTGCPQGSRPLIPMIATVQLCGPMNACAPPYSCYHSQRYGRWQCCDLSGSGGGQTSGLLMADQSSSSSSSCEANSVAVGGRCLKLFYLGQKGCEVDEQCSMRLAEAHCHKNYCICPRNKLIHQSKCVTHCPDGFIDIAARCRDLTTIVFMDSVDERINGTIGGFCKGTVIAEEQCDVNNTYCNEQTITCQCLPGFEMKLDSRNPKNAPECEKIDGSKFAMVSDSKADSSESRKQADGIEQDQLIGNTIDDDPIDLERFLLQSDDQSTKWE